MTNPYNRIDVSEYAALEALLRKPFAYLAVGPARLFWSAQWEVISKGKLIYRGPSIALALDAMQRPRSTWSGITPKGE